ncbi:HAD-IIIA family hydrolase [Clostridium sp. AL.422]|uniref:HAD family hydrolase n=1 Tax=Clostridium TaxID=1485 RepID=UPI00293DDE79|nr:MULTISPECIES: HAD-IIIA family hydrolase [unclassified Clostridium]MDV4149584.1 HAD-IIIA family hydrolase [Clostridium sp. AL.422]
MIKLAIFDLDGTLLNTLDDLANACNYALNKFSFPTHDVEKYKNFIGNGIYKLVERALPDNEKDRGTVEKVLKIFIDYYNEHMIDMTKPYDGIINTLDELRFKGIKLAVVSNKKHEFTMEIVKKYFGDKFDIVFGHRANYKEKPDPASVLEVIDKLNILKDECIYIGDSNIDIITARNAGVKSIGVSWGFRGKEELANEGADYLVDNTIELRSIIINN